MSKLPDELMELEQRAHFEHETNSGTKSCRIRSHVGNQGIATIELVTSDGSESRPYSRAC